MVYNFFIFLFLCNLVTRSRSRTKTFLEYVSDETGQPTGLYPACPIVGNPQLLCCPPPSCNPINKSFTGRWSVEQSQVDSPLHTSQFNWPSFSPGQLCSEQRDRPAPLTLWCNPPTASATTRHLSRSHWAQSMSHQGALCNFTFPLPQVNSLCQSVSHTH